MSVTKIEEVDAAIEAAVSALKASMDDYKKSLDLLLAKGDPSEELKKLIAESGQVRDEEVKKLYAEIENLKKSKPDKPELKAKALL